jgi:hypothetical protein
MSFYYRVKKDLLPEFNKAFRPAVKEDMLFVFTERFTIGSDAAKPINYPTEIHRSYLEYVPKALANELLNRHVQKDVVFKLKAEKPTYGLASWAFMSNDGHYDSRHNAPCHYSFDGTGWDSACTWNTFLLNKEQKKDLRELFTWIMNDSPWLHCIHPSWDILSAQERTDRCLDGPVLINMEAPANEVLSFAVALRVITEHSWTIRTYLYFREKGLPVPLSFMLAGHTQLIEDEKVIQYFNSDWHHFMNSNQNVEHLCKFFKTTFFKDDRDSIAFNKRRYRVVASQITRDRSNSIGELIKEHSTVVGTGWDVKSHVNVDKFLPAILEIYQNA